MDRFDHPPGGGCEDGLRCADNLLPHDPGTGADLVAGKRVYADGDHDRAVGFDGAAAHPGKRSNTK